MLLILSSSYISEDMQLELGRIPPCMIPLGGRCLLEHQLSYSLGKKVTVTLPDDYILSNYQKSILQKNNVDILSMPCEAPLGLVLAKSLAKLKTKDQITILFGDTLIQEQVLSLSCKIGVSQALGYYEWSIYDKKTGMFSPNKFDCHHNLVFNGIVSLPSKSQFLEVLLESDFDFIASINTLLAGKVLSTAELDSWLDFGHLQTYYNSKKEFTSERAFNSLTFINGFLEKKSTYPEKLVSEFKWFENLPDNLSIYIPTVIPSKSPDAYRVEYLNLLSLTEIYLFGELSITSWRSILNSCFHFLDNSSSEKELVNPEQWSLRAKTSERLVSLDSNLFAKFEAIIKLHGYSFDSLINLADRALEDYEESFCVVHGDFCFSNILYDFRASRIKLIDPRGCNIQGKSTIYGPFIYDVAKLGHSCIGRYDEIVSGRYEILQSDNEALYIEFIDENRNKDISALFLEGLAKRNISEIAVHGAMIHLFLSMLPLHSDCEARQTAFVLNAVRIANEVKLI